MRDSSDKTREGCTQDNKPAISRRSKAWYKQQMVRFINLLLQLWRDIEASVLACPFQQPTKSLPGYRNTGAVTVYRFHTNVPTTGKRLAKFNRPGRLLVPRNSTTKLPGNKKPGWFRMKTKSKRDDREELGVAEKGGVKNDHRKCVARMHKICGVFGTVGLLPGAP